jgi:hypothetical protein
MGYGEHQLQIRMSFGTLDNNAVSDDTGQNSGASYPIPVCVGKGRDPAEIKGLMVQAR